MATTLAMHWRTLALRGIVAIVFGLIAFFIPIATIYALTILFGAYALIDGIVNLSAAVHSARHGDHWWALLFEGIAGLGAAAVTMLWPLLTLVVLIYIIAAWAVVTGALELAAAIRLRRIIRGEWLLVVTGLASIAFGFLLFAAPGPGAVVIAWWIGAYVFIFGLLMLGLAFRLRRWSSAVRAQHA